MDVCEEESVEDKFVKLILAVKESKKKVVDVQFKYEIKTSELKMKLQPTMPPEVCEKRDISLNTALIVISGTVVECGKLLDEILRIWTSLQEDPNVQKIEDDIQQK